MKNKIILTLIFILLIGSSAFAAGTFYFGGKKQTLSGSTIEVQAGYYDRQLLTSVFTGLTPENLKAGVTIGGIAGTYGAGGMLPPTLTTTAVSDIFLTTASSGGNISTDGGSPVTARGVCWNTGGSPTISDSKTPDSTGTGIFTSSITGLTAGTTYYVRAYATNSAGTAYGDEVSFTTAAATLATLTTTAPTAITQTTATSGGNITNDGGTEITERGICYSTSHDPTTAGSKETSGSGTGSFTADMSSLTASTDYYVRAYAINSVGTAYGDEVSFTTSAALIYTNLVVTVAPTVTGTVEPYGGVYAEGSTAVLTAEAAADYAFSSWEGDASGTFVTTTVLMSGDKNVIARFISTRFNDNGDGTVTDSTTGLMWAADGNGAGCYSGGTRNWTQAIAFADGLIFAGYSDWRLPSIGELQAIIDLSRPTSPKIYPVFINTKNAYWSSTSIDGTAYGVYFSVGGTTDYSKLQSIYVRAVRP